MKTAAGNKDIRRKKQIKIIRYILEHGQASRLEIAGKFGFSMPTVIQNVTELIEQGWICEAGEYGSTGGRKARILKIQENFRCVAGIEIKKDSIVMVLMDLSLKIIDRAKYPLVYRDEQEYYEQFGEYVRQFVEKNGLDEQNACKLAGIGLSIPGIINQKLGIIQQSHILRVSDVDLNHFTRSVPYEMCIENDANNAAFAEARGKFGNVVYISLNDTVGGAIYLNGEVYRGENFKSAEIGHMVIVPGGRTCYCGKKGCLDAYCSAQSLRGERFAATEEFFEALAEQDEECAKVWDEYLEHLAIACGNLRVLFDCDIFLGGDIGSYIQDFQSVFEEKMKRYCNFDYTMSFVHAGGYKHGSAAIGAARQMINRYIESAGFGLENQPA